jgi:hypothetical protein
MRSDCLDTRWTASYILEALVSPILAARAVKFLIRYASPGFPEFKRPLPLFPHKPFSAESRKGEELFTLLLLYCLLIYI